MFVTCIKEDLRRNLSRQDLPALRSDDRAWLMPLQSLCLHAHFYQPPREDPLTGRIPSEVGAAPFRNWNERIHAECYRPNAELGNFARISFNVGPTLCAWLEIYDPDLCQMIAAQDRANCERFGVGNAMAQAYNHTILPLATRADKETQVIWGMADFERRFGRKPQGMWLPETAVDLETLAILAGQGIEFTILAPWQADCETLDSTEPYRVILPQGLSITVFFYHSGLSSEVSFNPSATANADAFAHQGVLPAFNADKLRRSQPQLLMIATDGELYGHHQTFRDQFLAHLINGASTQLGIATTFPARWLRQHTPRRTVKIRDKTSWSCHHGVMRWMGQCDCTPNYGTWKFYLRRAFDRLAAAMDVLYLQTLAPLKIDPWALRNRYIRVMHGAMGLDDLVAEASGKRQSSDVCQRVFWLLEAQRERQRMFTSCGWFFDDFSRIEPKNNVAYAAQVVLLMKLATGVDLGPQVAADLQDVISSHTGLRGDMVFKRQLQRALGSMEKHRGFPVRN